MDTEKTVVKKSPAKKVVSKSGPKPWDATFAKKPELKAVYVSSSDESLFYWREADAVRYFGADNFNTITNPNHK